MQRVVIDGEEILYSPGVVMGFEFLHCRGDDVSAKPVYWTCEACGQLVVSERVPGRPVCKCGNEAGFVVPAPVGQGFLFGGK